MRTKNIAENLDSCRGKQVEKQWLKILPRADRENAQNP